MSRSSRSTVVHAIGVATAAVALVLIVLAAAKNNHGLATWLGVPLMLGVVIARSTPVTRRREQGPRAR